MTSSSIDPLVFGLIAQLPKTLAITPRAFYVVKNVAYYNTARSNVHFE